jgi:prolyl-tRNA editing enzyme YbaK/EbsC (Cys-tRNA(Pro) deacylase)
MNPNQALKKSAQSVQDVLSTRGLECKVIELNDSTKTALDAAATIGCDVGQIVKSLIFKTKSTHKPVLILTSGPNRVNEKTIETLVGEQISKADADFTRDVTGFAIGGIPPIGHKHPIDLIYIDEDLMSFDSVWAAAGTPNAVFNLQSHYLNALTNGQVISIQ